MEAVGHDSEGDIEDGRNGSGPGIDVQVGGAVGAIIWRQDMGGDWVDAQGTDVVPPPGSATYHRDDSEMRDRQRRGYPLVE